MVINNENVTVRSLRLKKKKKKKNEADRKSSEKKMHSNKKKENNILQKRGLWGKTISASWMSHENKNKPKGELSHEVPLDSNEG